MSNWALKEATIGDTVKFTFADFTQLGTRIGVCIGFEGIGYTKLKIDFGDCVRVIKRESEIYVYEK